MAQFQNILVVVDGNQPAASGVVARAVRLAKPNGASLKLITVVEPAHWYSRLIHPTSDVLQSHIVTEKSEALEELAERVRQDGVTVSTEVLQGRSDIEMVRATVRGGYDLLMKEAEPNEHVLFGSTDMHLLRNCPSPVWLVKPGQGERPLSKILAPVDPAPPSDEADLLHIKTGHASKDPGLDVTVLELAGSLASRDGAELHVLHAWIAPGEEHLRGSALLTPEQVDRYMEDARAEARKSFDHLLASVPADPTVQRTVHMLKGEPADVIADFAKAGHIDLIVMGTVARTGIPGLFIGNTAESILQRVDCSVLAVKPRGFVSPVSLDG